ncbi:hypothetical protein IQ266_07295 [filamentous cyanobacterium LEGE 11480]|uniref:Uncharacterized protein n=1 Tax=Romeriopsis navalis LEGE 11480 TaxID=2777977 RepID=A0A928VJN4_9CYAN|nr:hypothetical protein [Romeriopsis navalis]MBE9029565.1 hypothetical protein [Romeriopsis navalis LEGE 11480]
MISTFTITLRGAFVARLLGEMAAMLCGSMGTLMEAALTVLLSGFGALPQSKSRTGSSRSMQLPRVAILVAISLFQRPFGCDRFVRVNDLLGYTGKYGVIDHILGWNCPERRKIRSEAYCLSAIRA